MRYLTRQKAHDIGLLPGAGSDDWWLLDSSRLIRMHFDSSGRPEAYELLEDPAVVVQACKWRDLAVHHSVLADQDADAGIEVDRHPLLPQHRPLLGGEGSATIGDPYRQGLRAEHFADLDAVEVVLHRLAPYGGVGAWTTRFLIEARKP